ncbi:MAG: hypothetical protein U5L95_05320 [Candidatus Saccharibacteria bacterium]|nr:hypothetical protein [Candidatus Saccharibacteria bacterium]
MPEFQEDKFEFENRGTEVEGAEIDDQPESLRELGRFASIRDKAKYIIETGVVGLIVSPANEIFTYAPAAAVQASTGNTLTAACTLGGLNALFQGAGTVASADLLDTNTSNKAVSWLNERLTKVTKGKRYISNPVVEANLAYWGGSSVVLAARQVENPSINKRERLKYGLFTTAWTSPVLTTQWLTVGNSIEDPSMTNIGVAGAATVGFFGALKYIKDKYYSAENCENESNDDNEAKINIFKAVANARNRKKGI